jgi:hypothetical protein
MMCKTPARLADIEKNLRMIQCLRSIALELIDFLSPVGKLSEEAVAEEEICGLQPLLHHAR